MGSFAVRVSPGAVLARVRASGSLTSTGDRVAMTKDQTLPNEPKAPKKLKHYLYDLCDIMRSEVTVLENGTDIVVTKQRAVLMRIVADAISGNPKALQTVSEFFKIGIPEENNSAPSAEFTAMLDRLEKDIKTQTNALFNSPEK